MSYFKGTHYRSAGIPVPAGIPDPTRPDPYPRVRVGSGIPVPAGIPDPTRPVPAGTGRVG